VLGGKNSSNTKKLFNIAKELNPHAFHIENGDDLRNPEILSVLARVTSVGITAGASTPPDEIERIKRNLININLQKESNHGETKRDKAH
jgi:4-hydroxy-3-methylbut-2-enyl diphosphate reductase